MQDLEGLDEALGPSVPRAHHLVGGQAPPQGVVEIDDDRLDLPPAGEHDESGADLADDGFVEMCGPDVEAAQQGNRGDRLVALDPVVVRVEGDAVRIVGDRAIVRVVLADHGRRLVGIDVPGLCVHVAPLDDDVVEAAHEVLEVGQVRGVEGDAHGIDAGFDEAGHEVRGVVLADEHRVQIGHEVCPRLLEEPPVVGMDHDVVERVVRACSGAAARPAGPWPARSPTAARRWGGSGGCGTR